MISLSYLEIIYCYISVKKRERKRQKKRELVRQGIKYFIIKSKRKKMEKGLFIRENISHMYKKIEYFT